MLKTTTLILIILLTGCNNLISNSVIKNSTKPVEVKESIKPSAKPSTFSNSTGQAQIVNKNNSNSSNTMVIPTPKPIPTAIENFPNNSTNLTGNITPNPTPTPTIVPEIELIRVDNPNGEVVFYKPINSQKPYKVWYNITDNTNIRISFVEEYKIRYNKEKKEFYSLLNIDLLKFNNLIKNYKIEIFPAIEEKYYTYFEEIENRIRKENISYDFVSITLTYSFKLENKEDVKDFILKIRNFNFIRDCNNISELGTTD